VRFADVYRVVRLIPKGMVMSYSGVARQCGRPRSARYVGFALHALLRSPARDRVPWWRVINAQGRISNQYAPEEQRRRLEAEGVIVGDDLRVDMRLFDAELIVRQKLRRSATRGRPDNRAAAGC
jgi:methylated-DNA-protein-cysteine methyltransferase-like protein